MKNLLDATVAFGDPQILDMVTKADMTRVLSGLGWHRGPIDLPFGSELWKKYAGRDDETAELIVVDRVADRVARIGEFVHHLHLAEGIPTLRVVLALLPHLPIGDDR